MDGILSKRAIRRMLTNTENKINLFEELNRGVVVLIDADERFLGEATSFFGRLFYQVVRARSADDLTEEDLTPTFVYVDEFADYAKEGDRMITDFVAKARRRKLGLVTAFQRMHNIDPDIRDAILSQSAIRMVGGVDTNVDIFKKPLRTTEDFLLSVPQLSFATWIDGYTASAVKTRFTPGALGAIRLVFPKGFSPENYRFNLHRVGEGELYCTDDPLGVLLAYQNGVENVISFLDERAKNVVPLPVQRRA